MRLTSTKVLVRGLRVGEHPLGTLANMCTTATELKAAMRAYSLAFEPGSITSEQAASVVDDMASIEKIAAAVKAAAAARAVDTHAWDLEGDASPAHTLAKKTGTTVRQAEETISTAKRLKEMQTLESAARRGEL